MAAQTTDLQAENQRLRKELREAELRAGGWEQIATDLRVSIAHAAKAVIAEPDLERAITHHKSNRETWVHRADITSQATDALYAVVGIDPMHGIASLNDLAMFTRDQVASARGVGPKSMVALDAAMADAGLSWAEEVAG
jgi:hypothetical protein